MEKKKVLHVGSGGCRVLGTRGFNPQEWTETRLDINPDVEPDIVCSMTDMSIIEDCTFDAVFSSHNIEHLYWHEIRKAFREFWRVLKPTGFLLIYCPDIQEVAKLIAEDKLLDPAYCTGAGYPIAPIDMMFGWREALEKGEYYMAHKSAFTLSALKSSLSEVGFGRVVGRQEPMFNLHVLATVNHVSDGTIDALFEQHS